MFIHVWLTVDLLGSMMHLQKTRKFTCLDKKIRKPFSSTYHFILKYVYKNISKQFIQKYFWEYKYYLCSKFFTPDYISVYYQWFIIDYCILLSFHITIWWKTNIVNSRLIWADLECILTYKYFPMFNELNAIWLKSWYEAFY